jgi:7,8-dihydropterin-6-yl-methyl-4-(beta-D-ribofuranosyl)aminobenzene 5'-phosphate synthase
MMFDAGPEGQAWERNAKRLGVDLASIERIQLSHWHRDHSGNISMNAKDLGADRLGRGHDTSY